MYDWSHRVPLGDYPEEHFTEKIPRKLIKEFQGRLKVLKTHIEVRNESLEVPYTYLNPTEVENSVALWVSDGVSSSAVGKSQVHINKNEKGCSVLTDTLLLHVIIVCWLNPNPHHNSYFVNEYTGHLIKVIYWVKDTILHIDLYTLEVNCAL